VLQTWFRGQFSTCSSNSTVPIVPPPPYVLRWISTSDPPSGTIRQGFTSKLPTPIPGTQPRVVRGQFAHAAAQILTVPIVPPTTLCAVGLHFRSTHWYHKTRLQHPNYPPLHPGRNQCRRRGFGGQFGTCSSNSTVPLFRHHHHKGGGIGSFRSTPLVP
jgi:hypothetical protein